jgi:hypothetical protein
MADAYLETTVLADFLLKPKTPKQQKVKEALGRYQNTLLPVYSIKEWKAGPLNYFAYLHDKLVSTKSLANTFQALSVLPQGYRRSTSMEALAAAAQMVKDARFNIVLGGTDEEQADSYRLALYSLIMRSWAKRRKFATKVVDELTCYTEAAPRVGKTGLFDFDPKQCEDDDECCLATRLKAEPAILEALRNAIPEKSGRNEYEKRRQALKQLIKHPKERVNRETCRHLGDAIFAFFCPENAVILTTNLRDHEPLAKAVGKKAEKP